MDSLARPWTIRSVLCFPLDGSSLPQEFFAPDNRKVGLQPLRGTYQLQHSVHDLLFCYGSLQSETFAQFRIFYVHHVLAYHENQQYFHQSSSGRHGVQHL